MVQRCLPMMGQLPQQQNALFYDFCLEKHIPHDHLLRQIDQFLDFDSFKEHLKPHYSHTGRPSIDPELMIRMLLLGYCYGIRSERRLCEEVHFNLAYRWFCKLGLEDDVPDHSSFSKNRHGRFRESDLFLLIFDSVVHSCHQEGLIKAEGFASDASYIRADAAWENSVFTEDEFECRRRNSRAVNEYLDSLDEKPLQVATPKRISLTDPIARWKKKGGPARFYYSTNYLIDIANNIIVDVEATPSNNILEVDSTRLMIERVEQKLSIKPKRLMADTAYGTGPMLDWLVQEKQIEPYIPVWDKADQNPETFSLKDFKFNKEKNRYICPAGKELTHGRRKFKNGKTASVTKASTMIYRAYKPDCDACKYKMQCTPTDNARKIARSIYEESREITRKIIESEKYAQSFKDRRKVEVLFGHLKRIMKLDRLRLRGLTGASDEFILAATAQNLKKLAQQRFKPPDHRIAAPA